ncbi:MAG: YicC family protein [Rhodobacterales bacterium]|nr:MAG: YicC family protein [Rhodobacterales bacterium]
MIKSMTGFASSVGQFDSFSWQWDLRSVNAKGLDLRLRVPDWITGLETDLRKRLGAALGRGNVALSLRLTRSDEGGRMRVNPEQMRAVLEAMTEIENAALDCGLSLAPSRAADILSVRGVLDSEVQEDDPAPLKARLVQAFEGLLEDFLQMRAIEGEALDAVLTDQLNQIETLVAKAHEALRTRKEDTTANLRAALARVMDNVDSVDAARLEQELAMIAVKSDVTEEMDRLRAHIDAARDLLNAPGPVGRKMDFLAQEFNREANTLCSKAQSKTLTTIGLDLKAVIDQMREQVQNVE